RRCRGDKDNFNLFLLVSHLSGRKNILARGVSHNQYLYFLFVLLSLFFFVGLFILKHKKN
ncbi:hypothetical protein Q8G71_37435, partial [Klebsiella pneumoniae]